LLIAENAVSFSYETSLYKKSGYAARADIKNLRNLRMNYHLWSDVVVLLHASFVLFVLLGGLAVLRWQQLIWLHLPAAVWGAAIELGGWICPLTYLENHLRRMGGGAGYNVTFIERYLEPLLYPLGLTRHTQLLFGLTALLINLTVYARLWSQRRKPPDTWTERRG
jgi:hypothetical protein